MFSSCSEESARKEWAEKKYGKKIKDDVKAVKLNSRQIVKINITDNELDNGLINISEIVDSINYVPLDTKKTALIGMIDKIIVRKNRIYILDQLQAKSIFIYDWGGKLINVINKLGKGPGEYIGIRDFSVTESGKIYIFDSETNKALAFDSEGNFIADKKIPYYFTSAAAINDNRWVFSTNYSSQNYHFPSLLNHNLLYANVDFSIKGKALPYEKINQLLRVSSGADLFSNDKITYLAPFLNDTIYQVNENDLMAKYVVLFDKNAFSRSVIIKDSRLKSQDAAYDIYHQASEKGNYALHPVAFSDHMLYFPVSHNDKVSMAYFDTKNKRIYAGSKYNLNGVPNCLAYNSPIAGYGEYLIGFIGAEIFENNWLNFKKTFKISSTKYDQIKGNHNPIIFFAKIRKPK